jgi:alkanesulfonate monooxygenase SsuD/methylene tetrahydromethanopterin reductase-like flavin-dependent oxidoreductase (luciferase family)
MADRKFRFGVVAGQMPDMTSWTGLARRIEDSGYSTVLVPDTFRTLEPFVALSAAAAVTTRLRLAPFVLAAPLRLPGAIARDAASLDRLSGGRFDLGLGAGRPDAQSEADLLGVPFGSVAQRIEQVAEIIRSMRVRLLRELAGNRFDDLELGLNIASVGDYVPEWITGRLGIDPAKAVGNRAVSMLTGDTAEIVDVLQRRRDQFDISYLTVGAFAMETFAPVVERLAGR